MPKPVKATKFETPRQKKAGSTFQRSFFEKFSVKNFAAQMPKREMTNPF
jgi:hypothetical protein